jgi:hypothetical protein
MKGIIMIILFTMSIFGCSRQIKDFAIKGYENDISWDGTDEREKKIIVNNEIISIRYTCLTLNEDAISYAYLLIESKTENELNILRVNWEHYFNEKLIKDVSSETNFVEKMGNSLYRYVNQVPPFKLNSNTNIVLYKFRTTMKTKDFKVGDIIEVKIDIEYEIDGRAYTVKDTIPIVVQMRYAPESML